MEVISSDEKFNVEEFEYFASFQDCAVVGIIGPQSIGKSTLLNHLFDTNFKEWDRTMGRGTQTTKGIWVAKANKEPVNVLVMDLEGTDSKERAEVNADRNVKSFENKIALFALLFGDVLLINIGFKDIGKDCAANRPLLKTILQIGLAMESFNTSSKKTLFFVIRDTVPFVEMEINDVIERQTRNIIEIWGEVHKPEGHENTSLNHFFNVKVFPLPLYPTNENQFKDEVDKLRLEILTSIEEGFADSGFYKNAKSIWETIKQNPDLNIPSINVLVAFLKCDEFARMKLRDFEADQGWLSVRQDVEKSTFVSDFGARIKSILSTHLSDYDSKTLQWKSDEEVKVKTEKCEYLKSEVYSVVDPVYISNLSHLCSKQLQSFKTELDHELTYEGDQPTNGEGDQPTNSEGRIRTGLQSSMLMNSCMKEFDRFVVAAKPDQDLPRWDALNVRQQLIHDIQLHISNKLLAIVNKWKKQLSKNLKQDLNRLFDAEEEITWTSIRGCLNSRVNEAMTELNIEAAVLQPARDENIRNDLGLCAREEVKNKFRDTHDRIQRLLMIRYNKINSTMFESHRRLNVNDSVEECSNVASKEAYRGCVKFLSTVAVLRFDENTYNDVEATLISALLDNGVQISDSFTWEQVPAEDTLFTPHDCNETWVQFKQELERAASPERQRELTAVASKAFNWKPVKWVAVAVLTLGAAGAMCVVLRCTNLDLIILGSLSKEAFLFIAEFVGAAVMTAGALILLFELLRELVRNNDTDGFAEFRRKHRAIMKHLRKALKRFFSFFGDRWARSTESTA